jgi:hypothetical protein
MKTKINNLIKSASKTDTHLTFLVEFSVPLDRVSGEMVDDVVRMCNDSTRNKLFNQSLEITQDDEGTDIFQISVNPKL